MATTGSDALLTAVAAIEAFMARDREKLDVLLAPGTDVTMVVQNVLRITEALLKGRAAETGADVNAPLDELRRITMQLIAKRDDDS